MKTFDESLNDALHEAKTLHEASRKQIGKLEQVLIDIGVNYRTNFTPSLTRIVANTSSEDITYEYDNKSIAFYSDRKLDKRVYTNSIDDAVREMIKWIDENHWY